MKITVALLLFVSTPPTPGDTLYSTCIAQLVLVLLAMSTTPFTGTVKIDEVQEGFPYSGTGISSLFHFPHLAFSVSQSLGFVAWLKASILGINSFVSFRWSINRAPEPFNYSRLEGLHGARCTLRQRLGTTPRQASCVQNLIRCGFDKSTCGHQRAQAGGGKLRAAARAPSNPSIA